MGSAAESARGLAGGLFFPEMALGGTLGLGQGLEEIDDREGRCASFLLWGEPGLRPALEVFGGAGGVAWCFSPQAWSSWDGWGLFFPKTALGGTLGLRQRVKGIDVGETEAIAPCCGVNLAFARFWGCLGELGGQCGLLRRRGRCVFPERNREVLWDLGRGSKWLTMERGEVLASCCGVNLALAGVFGGAWGSSGGRRRKNQRGRASWLGVSGISMGARRGPEERPSVVITTAGSSS